MSHSWLLPYGGGLVSDATHAMYYKGQKIKEVYLNGECVWKKEDECIIAKGDWWTLYCDGYLHIYCIGDMPWNQNSESSPWYPYRTQVRSLKLENSVTQIFHWAFLNCVNLDYVEIPDSIVNGIGQAAFANTGRLLGFRFPSSLTSISDYCFEGSKIELDVLIIPDSVTQIGYQAFRYCDNIKHLIVHANASGDYPAFTDMNALEDVILLNPGPVTGGDFSDCDNLTKIYIPVSVTAIPFFFALHQNYYPSLTTITDVYYEGSQAQWNAIQNSWIAKNYVTVHYNSPVPTEWF